VRNDLLSIILFATLAIGMIVVATFGVGLPASCRMISPVYAKYAVLRRRSASFCVVSYGYHSLIYAIRIILCRLRDDRRRGAWRRVSSVVSYRIPRLIVAIFGILSRRRDDRRRVACRMSSRCSSLNSECCVGVGTMTSRRCTWGYQGHIVWRKLGCIR
jgi:hypothetical protein